MEILFAGVFALFLLVYVTAGLAFFVGLYLPVSNGRGDEAAVSVIIAARNEAANIAECLACLIDQTYASYEVVVADDQSEDQTAEIVKRIAGQNPKIKYVRVPETPAGVSPKKNALSQAIAVSTGEILLFTDADCRVHSRWIQAMVRYFETDVGAVIGFSTIRGQGLVHGLQAIDFMALMTAARGGSNIGLPWAASGQNLAYRRKVYDAVGGFESIKHRVSGDDVLMLGLIRKSTPWKVRFADDPASFVDTSPEPSLSAYLNQRTRWASNGRFQSRLNPLFFFYLLCVLLLNTLLVVGGLVAVFSPAVGLITLFSWIVKLVVDFSVVASGCVLFGQRALIRFFPLWFFLQPVYIPYVALRASAGSFVWKGRRSRAGA